MAAAAGSQHRCVFVGNIPYDATEEQLIQICEEVGPVVSFRLVLDRETGKPKGYGFCEYKDEETALSARRNLQGYEINGRQLRVDFAENDKGADRNREQGRGGPGLTSNADAHKGLPAPSILGDSTPHQPIGHPIAATAASVMARTLGGAQTSSLPLIQNGLQNLSGLGNDPLTHYLAKMSRQQLNEIMSEMKALAVQNKPLAQQLLQGIPRLSKALFQAEIMLGMVTPQMMQMASNQQSLSTVPKPSVPDSMLNQKPLLPSHQSQIPSHRSQIPSQNNTLVGPLSRPPETQVSNALQNPLVLQQSAVPFQHVHAQPPYQQPLPSQPPYQQPLPSQPPYQQPLPSQPQIHPQGMMPGSIRPQPHVSLANQPQIPPLSTSKGLISQGQPLHLQHSRPAGVTNVMHHPPPAHRDMSLQNQDLSWASRASTLPSSGVGLAEQHDLSEVMNHRLKRPRLEEGGGSHPFTTNSFSTMSSVSAQPIEVGRLVGSQIHNNAEVKQHTEKQKSQLLPEVESALLQQVMNLTPDQLSSLTPEQRQQVLQLQQMLR